MTPKENGYNQPYLIGKAFEDYALEILFPREEFDLLERAPEYTSNKKHFALNALNPDFKFKDKKTGLAFFVEAKYRRRHEKSNEIKWTYPAQLSRYRAYNQSCPTFVLIGAGGSPESPDLIGLIPIEQACYIWLFVKTIKRFKVPATSAVSSEMLRNFYL
jgi:hypothetical protein